MADKSAQEQPEEKGFKVIDRRVGAETAPEPARETSPKTSTETSSPARETAAEPPDQVLGPIDFSTFLVSLASSALIHLGETPHPDTGTQEVSLHHAQQTIDLIALLEVKTEGNRTPDESKLLQALLRDLRLRYVAVTSRAK